MTIDVTDQELHVLLVSLAEHRQRRSDHRLSTHEADELLARLRQLEQDGGGGTVIAAG